MIFALFDVLVTAFSRYINCSFVHLFVFLTLLSAQVQDTNATVIPATGLNAIASHVVHV